MDYSEDVSARILLRNVLYTEPARSPITRSMSQQPSAPSNRRSHRLRKSDAGLLSPQIALRQKLRQNIHENISKGSPLQQRKRSLPLPGMMGKVKTPAVMASYSQNEDDITPRGLLRGILRTEPEASLLVPDRLANEETGPCSTESSLCSSRPSLGITHMSNLELPDMPTENLTRAVTGISRKRPKRNMNVSVFERKLGDQSSGDSSGDGAQDATGNMSPTAGTSLGSTHMSNLELPDMPTENLTRAVTGISRKRPKRNMNVSVFERKLGHQSSGDNSGVGAQDATGNMSTTAGTSDLSLTLKTPYVDLPMDRQGLRRYAGKRKAIRLEDFEAEVDDHLAKRTPDREQSLSKTAGMEQFSLGLSNTTATNMTNIMSDTALYPLPVSVATTAHNSIMIHEKETVTSTQIIRELQGGGGGVGGRMQDDVREEEVGGDVCEDAGDVGGRAGETGFEDEAVDQMEEQGVPQEEVQGTVTEEEEQGGESQEEEDEQGGKSQEEEDEQGGESQEEEEVQGTVTEEEEQGGESQEEEEEQGGESQEEEEVQGTMSEEEVQGAEEEEVTESEREAEEKEAPFESSGKEEDGEKGIESDREPGKALRSTWTQEEGEATEFEMQEEEVASGQELVRMVEHISRRAYRSEGVMKIPGTAAGGRGYKSLSSGLQPMGPELETSERRVEPVKSSEGGASSEWPSRREEGNLEPGDVRPHSPLTRSPVSSPSEIPLSPEHLHTSGGRSLSEQEDMGGASYADEVEDKENSGPPVQPRSPEIDRLTPHTFHTSTRVQPNAVMRTEEDDDDEWEEGEDDISEGEEVPMETPAFVRERKRVLTPGPSAKPDSLKQMMEARKLTQPATPAAKPKAQRKRQAGPSKKEAGLSKSYVMSTFKHFAKTSVSPQCYPVLKDVMAKYFDRLADDLEAYATHAKRKTIKVEDVELLMRRQGFVTDSMPVNILIEKYLPLEYRKLLIPVATSGNKVVPKQRR